MQEMEAGSEAISGEERESEFFYLVNYCFIF